VRLQRHRCDFASLGLLARDSRSHLSVAFPVTPDTKVFNITCPTWTEYCLKTDSILSIPSKGINMADNDTAEPQPKHTVLKPKFPVYLPARKALYLPDDASFWDWVKTELARLSTS